MKDFERHEVTWTEEKLARFWDFFSSLGMAYEDEYFSNIWGDDILDYAEKTGVLNGKVVDFGCGPGHLMAKLFRRGVACEGLDFSEHSIDEVKKRFANEPLFRGGHVVQSLPSDIPDASVDVLFFIETIEHVLPEQMEATLKEFERIVRKGGRIVVTTPHAENLDRKKVCCPDCGAVFHRVQHIRSSTVDSLNTLFAQYGFEPAFSKAVTFYPHSFLNLLRKFRDEKINKHKPHHLIYIGQKK